MMTLTIDIPADVEARLRDEAARQGVELARYVAERLAALVAEPGNGAKCLSREETELLQKINSGFSPETVQRYRELVARRRAEVLTPAEHEELIRLSDGIEQANAFRVGQVIDLARLRGVPVDDLIQELGIPLPGAGDDE